MSIKDFSEVIYEAGVGRADITPPVGIGLFGFTVREDLSEAVLEPHVRETATNLLQNIYAKQT